MNNTKEIEAEIHRYMKGEITLISIRKKFNLNQGRMQYIINKMFAFKKMRRYENWLYDMRMQEVSIIRLNNFTQQEISTQLF